MTETEFKDFKHNIKSELKLYGDFLQKSKVEDARTIEEVQKIVFEHLEGLGGMRAFLRFYFRTVNVDFLEP